MKVSQPSRQPGCLSRVGSSIHAATALLFLLPCLVGWTGEPPGNDLFANATILTGSSVTVSASNETATKEAGEPAHAGNAGGRSLWWTWTAPANGPVVLETQGSPFDTTLAVYTGADLSTLTMVAANDDLVVPSRSTRGNVASRLSFPATEGTTYSIAVDGFALSPYSVDSGTIVLNLRQGAVAPQISDQPQDLIVPIGTNATFSVGAFGSPPLGYQWFREGTLLPDATNLNFSVTNAQPGDSGHYFVTVTDAGGTATSSVATLSVEPVVIVAQPRNLSVAAGYPATFAVAVAASLPISFQWQKDGVPIVDATNGTYNIATAQFGDAGNYNAVIITDQDTRVCSNAVLSVMVPYTFVTFAGMSGQRGTNDGSGASARLAYPHGIAVDAADNVYVTELGNYSIRKITPDGTVSTVARLGRISPDWNPYGGGPWGLAIDAETNIYVADTPYHTILKITPDGRTNILAGSAGIRGNRDGTNGAARFYTPSAVAVDSSGQVYVADWNNDSIRKVTPEGVVTTMIGIGGYGWLIDSHWTKARILSPAGIVIDRAGVLWISDEGNNVLRRMTPFGDLATLATGFKGPHGGAFDGAGNFYLADMNAHTIRRVTPDGTVTTIAGQPGEAASAVGSGTAARFAGPRGTTVDRAGNVYVADLSNHAVRKGVPFAVTKWPQSQEVYAGTNVTLDVTVLGTDHFSYQWRFNGTPLTGETNSALLLTSVTEAASGVYSVIVCNSAGNWIPVDATLRVWALPHVFVWGANNAGRTNAMSGPTNVVVIAGGGTHNLALRDDATLIVWGDNTYGQVNAPLDLQNVVGLAAGPARSLALLADGRVVSWGDRVSTSTNRPFGLTLGAVGVAAGGSHNLALSTDGTVAVWGDNSQGQTNIPAQLANVVAIAGGLYHSLALRADGSVIAWGRASEGQCAVPTDLTNAVAVAAGGYFSVALRADGMVQAWGAREPGSGVEGKMDPPEGLTQVIAIAAGQGHCLALKADGTVVGWGDSSVGQTNIPPLVTTAGVSMIAAGGFQSLALVDVGAPRLVAPAIGRTIGGGTTLRLLANAAGAWPLSYQWQFDGVDIPAATNAILILENVRTDQSGQYAVRVGNAHGALTNAISPVEVVPILIDDQPADVVASVAKAAAFNVTAQGFAPLGYQWRKADADLPGATDPTLTLTNLSAADRGWYSVVVTGPFGSVTSRLAELTVNLAPVEKAFDPGASGAIWTNGAISTIAMQPDGKILVGGGFTWLGGHWSPGIGRLNQDGTLDAGFNPGADGKVHAFAIQPDARILVGGGFSSLGWPSRSRLARLNPNGTPEAEFNPTADGTVTAFAIQGDGRILVGGAFATMGGTPRSRLARLNADGTVDLDFHPELTGNLSDAASAGSVATLAIQPDGKLLVAGDFSTIDGISRNGIARLNTDGTLDLGFNPGTDSGVNALLVQADGKILVGGKFMTLDGQPRARLGRLNSDGTLDLGFDPAPNGEVSSLALQADGRIIVAGSFSWIAGGIRSAIGRLNSDGTLDPGFAPQVEGSVSAIGLQADGQCLIGGEFQRVEGVPRSRLARLAATDPALASLDQQSRSVTWMRGGTAPEVGRTALEYSADGLSWANLGEGIRVSGGWEMTTPALPPAGLLRARGWQSGGGNCGSSWLVEYTTLVRNASVFVTQPSSRTNDAGTTATFSVQTLPLGSVSCQWQKQGVPLTDGGNILGSGTFALTLSDVFARDAGEYSAVVSYADGRATSEVARLVVNDPIIVTQPLGQRHRAGENATFKVEGFGTPPLTYQWFQDGTPIPGATGDALDLEDLRGGDGGDYRVMVINQAGSTTSAVARLDVTEPVITCQLEPCSGEVGGAARFTVEAMGTDPVTYRWLKDGIPVDGAAAASLTLTNLQPADAGAYSVVVITPFGTATNEAVSLRVNLVQRDEGFVVETDGSIETLAVQTDGRVVLGGWFGMVNDQPRTRIARINANGSLDEGFDPGAAGPVSWLALQADGRILLGGFYRQLWGQSGQAFVRLLSDGTIDGEFHHEATELVNALAVQADGKILLAGDFTNAIGQTRYGIIRLDADGTRDGGFELAEVPGYVNSLALQSDGGLLAGGQFRSIRGQPRNGFGRLHADGSLDERFNPALEGAVNSVATQPDGKVLIGGSFTRDHGRTYESIVRLNADGSWDESFKAREAWPINKVMLQSDGRVLLSGHQGWEAWESATKERSVLRRINADGSPDYHFDPRIEGEIDTLTLQPDGKILVSGYHVGSGGQFHGAIWRFQNTYPATQSLTSDGSTLTWLRGGSGPEVWRAYFESSTNGQHWVRLGEGTRIAGGWQLSGLHLSPGNVIRARGQVAGGNVASGWYVEELIGPPFFSEQPASRTNLFDTTAWFAFRVGESGMTGCQWYKDGVALEENLRTTGVNAPTLTLSNVTGADAGRYRVVVSNAMGSITSLEARLVVPDPAVTLEPLNARRNRGAEVAFKATSAGIPPLAYQWFKDGVAMDGRAAASLYLTNLTGSDAGNYYVVLAREYGSQTSAIASLTVNLATADDAFDPGWKPRRQVIDSLVIQSDGRIVLGGNALPAIGGVPSGLARLNADGTVDLTFNPESNTNIMALAIQADGKLLVGGAFGMAPGGLPSGLARLNADGTTDRSFSPGVAGSVDSLAIQADGQILAAGTFTSMAGQVRHNIARLHADGTLDRAFDPDVDATVSTLAIQPDGKILLGGWFTQVGGLMRSHIARLNSDGSPDLDFNPGADSAVESLTVQPDGKVIVVGGFTRLNGQPRSFIGRLNADGTLDRDFDPSADGWIYSTALQTDGKILLGGHFSTLQGQPRSCIARLNSDGRLDPQFDPGADAAVYTLAIQSEGSVLVGGYFSTLDGLPRACLGRLRSTDPGNQTLGYDGSTLTWLRSGSVPEVWHTTFDASTNGAEWVSLGAGTRITAPSKEVPSGWQLRGVSLKGNNKIRARGQIAGAERLSGWFAESVETIILSKPELQVAVSSFEAFTYLGSKTEQVLTVTNAGSVAAAEVVLTYAAEPAFTILSAAAGPGGVRVESGRATVQLGDLPVGAKAKLSVGLLAVAAGSFTNRVDVASAHGGAAQVEIPLTVLANPPSLAIEQSPAGPVLTWPAAGSGFLLQSSPSLSPPIGWTAVTNAVMRSDQKNRVLLPATERTTFYRLVAP